LLRAVAGAIAGELALAVARLRPAVAARLAIAIAMPRWALARLALRRTLGTRALSLVARAPALLPRMLGPTPRGIPDLVIFDFRLGRRLRRGCTGVGASTDHDRRLGI